MSKYDPKEKETNKRFPNVRQDGTRQCVWCGTALTGRKKRWCGDKCVHEYNLLNDMKIARAAVYERDKGVCAICAVNVETEKKRWRNQAEKRYRDNGLPERSFRISFSVLIDIDKELGAALLRYGWHSNVDRDWWEADHIHPQYKGGTNEQENLRTLCVPCHKAVTAIQARERAFEKKKNKADKNPQTKLDIPGESK